MGAEEGYNGLTLEGLAQRLETLEHENAALREEVAALRGSAIGGAVETGYDSEELLSSDRLLNSAYPPGPVESGRESTAPHQRSGTIFPDRVYTKYVEAENTDREAPTVPAIYGLVHSTGAAGVQGVNASSGPGLLGEGGTGVWGKSWTIGHSGVYGSHASTPGYGIVGDGNGVEGAGVLGRNTSGTPGYGVVGQGNGSEGSGVLGQNIYGAGVRGRGNTGVWGQTSAPGQAGVVGQHVRNILGQTEGYGVIGLGKGGAALGCWDAIPPGSVGASRVARRSCGSYPEVVPAHLLPKHTAGARCIWTRRQGCSCARALAPQERGGGLTTTNTPR